MIHDNRIVWYVCFHHGKCLWGRRFRHVSLVGFHDGTWIDIDLHRRGASIATFFRHDEVEEYRRTVLSTTTLVYFGPPQNPTMRSFLRPLTCVAFVKHTLGIKCGALRPDTLFRNLKRDFDVEVFNEPATHSGIARNGSTATSG